MAELAAQSAEAMRVAVELVVGYHVRPRKRAKVKRELTLTMLSKAMMWMAVVVSLRRECDTSDICG